MFDFIRSHQRVMQFLLLVLIVPSFALIGVSGYSSYVSGDHDLVKIGKTAVTLEEFDRARSNQLRQMQESSPGGFDPAVLDNPAVRTTLLESLVDYRVLATTVADEYFSVSDTFLRQSIASMPQLQVDGQFSAERYNDALAAAGLTPRDFEQSQRFELALGRVLGPVAQSASAPSPVIDYLKQALIEARTVRLHAYSAQDYSDAVSVSDSDIRAWYDEHKQNFQIPDQVSVQYLLLDEEAAMANLPDVSEQDLLNYYEQNKARFTQTGRINLSHILINVPAGSSQDERSALQAQAQALAEQVQTDPSQFADLAREHSQDAGSARNGGSLGWVTQGTWPPALDRAIFALDKGETSDVVEGHGGYHVFIANDVQPEQVQALDEVRDTIRQEIRHQMGAERFADMATRLTSLVYDQQDSLEPAAQALGVSLRTAQGITRDGLLPESDVAGDNAAATSQDSAILDDVRVRQAVFSPQVLNERLNSGIIEISPDTMLTVRVQDITPAHVPEVEQVSDRIRELLIAQRAHELAVQAGQQALAELTQNGTVDTQLPEEFGDPVTVSRINSQGIQKPIVDAALAVEGQSIPSYTGVETLQGFVIAHVEEATTEPTADAGALAALPSELSQLWGQAEQDAVLKTMRTQAQVEFLPEAHDAINSSDNN